MLNFGVTKHKVVLTVCQGKEKRGSNQSLLVPKII